MLLPTILALCALSLSNVNSMSLHNGGVEVIEIAAQKYKKEVLVDHIWAKKIAVNKKDGNMYIVDVGSNLHRFKKGENSTEKISLSSNTFVNTFVVLDEFLAIGCNNGLKILEERRQIIEDVPNFTEEILDIFFYNNTMNETLYAVTSQGNKVVKYVNSFYLESDVEEIKHREEQLDITVSEIGFGNIVVDSNGNLYYNGKEDRLTRVWLESDSTTIAYDGEVSNFYMAVDNYGTVYGTAGLPHNTLYRLESNGSIELIATLDFVPMCMCFDENNDFVFATTTEIFTLKKLEENSTSCDTDLLKKIYKNEVLLSDNSKTIIALLETIKDNQEKTSTKYNDLLSKINISEEKNRQLEEKVVSLGKKIGSVIGDGNMKNLLVNETGTSVNIAIHNVGRLTVHSPGVGINTKRIGKVEDCDVSAQ